jgi:diguanylate cyclase (GGDEF)-like protein
VTYALFERITLAVGGLAIAGTMVAGVLDDPVPQELVAQVLLLGVLLGAVHWGRNGGFVMAVIASLLYVLMRVPLLIEEGLSSAAVELILIRALSYGVVGILGGELCTRVKYIFASMEDANSLDHVTRVFNERFIGMRLKKMVAEHERYETPGSAFILTLDPGLYLPLRKYRRRQILRSVASSIRNSVRLVDDVGRLEDSRFLVVLPQTPREGAIVAAQRVRTHVRDLLAARDESLTVTVLGAPDDLQRMRDLLDTLDLPEPEDALSAGPTTGTTPAPPQGIERRATR